MEGLEELYKLSFTCVCCLRKVYAGYQCLKCKNFTLCEACFNRYGHQHDMQILVIRIGQDLSANENPAQKISMVKMKEKILKHASTCLDDVCSYVTCRTMKTTINHFKICQDKIMGNCSICKEYFKLRCFHVEKCRDADCMVPNCQGERHDDKSQKRVNPKPENSTGRKSTLRSSSKEALTTDARTPVMTYGEYKNLFEAPKPVAAGAKKNPQICKGTTNEVSNIWEQVASFIPDPINTQRPLETVHSEKFYGPIPQPRLEARQNKTQSQEKSEQLIRNLPCEFKNFYLDDSAKATVSVTAESGGEKGEIKPPETLSSGASVKKNSSNNPKLKSDDGFKASKQSVPFKPTETLSSGAFWRDLKNLTKKPELSSDDGYKASNESEPVKPLSGIPNGSKNNLPNFPRYTGQKLQDCLPKKIPGYYESSEPSSTEQSQTQNVEGLAQHIANLPGECLNLDKPAQAAAATPTAANGKLWLLQGLFKNCIFERFQEVRGINGEIPTSTSDVDNDSYELVLRLRPRAFCQGNN